MKNIKYPKLKPSDTNTFVLLEDYEYLDVLVPSGFITNGADIPRIFWIFVPPFKPKFLPAILVHDFLIENAKSKEDIVRANTYFENILIEIESSFITSSMTRGVKFYWKFIRRYK